VQAFDDPAWQVPSPSQVDAPSWVEPLHEAAAHTVPAGHSAHAPLPSQEPFCWQVCGTCTAHSSSGSVLAAMGPQVPSWPCPFFAAVHAWQRPPHAESQHTPSTQKPDWQPSAFVHAMPPPELLELLELELLELELLEPVLLELLELVWAHVPVVHVYPDTQSADEAHGLVHAPAEHWYGAQLVPLGLLPQLPWPLQMDPIRTSPWHVITPHGVPCGQSWHAPPPLHAPLSPQVDMADAVQSPSGFRPAATGPQVPSVPWPFFAAVHARQRPVQALLQHTPSTQKPDWQSAEAEHATPLAAGTTHALPTQAAPVSQSALVVHEVSHAPPEHA
jgi:hypothetical protein